MQLFALGPGTQRLPVPVTWACCLPRSLASDRGRGRLRPFAVTKQRVGLGLQDVGEDLTMVECRGVDHSGCWNQDLVDAELAQLLDRGTPDDTAHSRPDDCA